MTPDPRRLWVWDPCWAQRLFKKKKKPLSSLQNKPYAHCHCHYALRPRPRPLVLGKHWTTFCLYRFAFSGDVTYTESYTIWSFLIGFFIWHHVSRVTRDIPRVSASFLFMTEYLIVWMHHILSYPFISWWALGCFHLLAIVSSAARNIYGPVFCLNTCFQIWGMYLGGELLDHMGNPVLSLFEEMQKCSPKWLATSLVCVPLILKDTKLISKKYTEIHISKRPSKRACFLQPCPP